MNAAADEALAPETAAYRQYRRMIWQTIRARYAEAVAEAVGAGQDGSAAREAGARAVRGDMRAMMSELLVRAPVSALLEFLSGGGLDWGDAGERIFERGEAVSALIDRAYPRPTWTDLEFLGRDGAEDDARWSAWSVAWLRAIRAASPAAREMLGELPAGPPRTTAPQSASTLKGWAPWLASAVAMIGVTTVVVATSRE